MRKTAEILLTFFITLASAGMSLSQPTLRLPFNKKASIENGLSSYNIKKIIQDKYGFIWIATQDGLNRYDGRSFLIYNKSVISSRRLSGTDVWDMEEDPQHNKLWVATSYGGLNGIDLITGKVTDALKLQDMKGINSDWIRAVKLYKDQLWIGSLDGLTVYNTTAKSIERYDAIPFAKDTSKNFCIDKIFIDSYKNTWVFVANYGVIIYSAVTRKIISFYSSSQIQLAYKTSPKQFKSIVSLNEGNLLIGTDQGIRRIAYNKKGITKVSPGLSGDDNEFDKKDIVALSIDAFRQLWFSCGSKLYKTDAYAKNIKEVKDAYINIQGDWLNYTDAIFFDKDNNIWLGTRRGITYTKNRKPAFIPYNVSDDQSARIDHAFYVYPVNDSIVYAGTETSLLKINTAQNNITTVDKGPRYYFIAEHIDKKLLVSTNKNSFVYDPLKNQINKISDFYKELRPLDSMSINSLVYFSDSLAIIGTESDQGFYSWNYKKKTLHNFKNPETKIVNTCYKDKRNRIWILGDNVLNIYDPASGFLKSDSLKNPATNSPYDIFFDICEARGSYWLAAYGTGLIQLDSNLVVKKVYAEKNGLSNTGVYKIFALQDSLIFISTNNGLSVLHLNTGRFNRYYQEDGLHSNSFEENCGIYKNEKIYAGGVNGFTVIEPGNLAMNTVPPRLYFNHVQMQTATTSKDSSNLFLSSLQIPNNVLQTSINFSGLNYSNQSRTTFSYRIKELNAEWLDLGNQNFVSLIGLNPGKYNLEIKTANEDEVSIHTPLHLSLIYLPKWYQTLAFKFMVFMMVAGLLYALYLYRISQIKQQQKIRKDISGDLHDDIGTTLNTVKVYAHLAKKEPHNESHLAQIETSLTEATAGLRDIIWVLDDSDDTVHQFVERVKKFAIPIALAKNIHFECAVEPSAYDLIFLKKEKRNMLMICKESVNNSMKYSECKNIKVVIKRSDHKTVVTIEDDGKGFDFSKIIYGNGLRNIVYRAKQIGWEAEIVASSGKGTVITCQKF